MASPDEVASPPDWKKSVDELINGRESATRLASMISWSEPEKRILVEEVVGSISRALIGLGTGEDAETVKSPATMIAGDGRGDISGGKRKKAMRKRGAYKLRRNPYSCRTILAKNEEDGQVWRKYGQKEIYNAKFPRSYFRCTHKYDQGCQATRQVQRSEDDSSMFVITYMGEHTCLDPIKASASHPKSPYLICFDSNTIHHQKELPLSSSTLPLVQEAEDEGLSSLTAFEESARMDHGDITSVLDSSPSSLELDFLSGSFDVDDLLSFD